VAPELPFTFAIGLASGRGPFTLGRAAAEFPIVAAPVDMPPPPGTAAADPLIPAPDDDAGKPEFMLL
jgi:hypothetical protein